MRTSSSDESDQEEANFVKQLTRGSRKQKGKLPLKHFNCGKVGCFPSKCPYIDTSKNWGKGKEKKYQKGDKTRNKKSLYSREDDSFDEEDSDTDNGYELARYNNNEVLEHGEEDFDIEGEVNLEEEPISTVGELMKCGRNMFESKNI